MKIKLDKILNRKGFTLIELLIVVAIIGILATFLMVNFVGVRQRARDAQRKSDLRQIQSALELYRADQGTYPDQSSFASGNAISSGTTVYMKSVPYDPLNSAPYFYRYTTPDNASYTLTACLENTGDSQRDIPINPAAGCGSDQTSSSYTLQNP